MDTDLDLTRYDDELAKIHGLGRLRHGEQYAREVFSMLQGDGTAAPGGSRKLVGYRCPFCSTDGAFSVDPSAYSWNCDGCHRGGSWTEFVMLASSLDYVSAIGQLAKLVGYDVVPSAERESQVEAARKRRDGITSMMSVFSEMLARPEAHGVHDWLKRFRITETQVSSGRFGCFPFTDQLRIQFNRSGKMHDIDNGTYGEVVPIGHGAKEQRVVCMMLNGLSGQPLGIARRTLGEDVDEPWLVGPTGFSEQAQLIGAELGPRQFQVWIVEDLFTATLGAVNGCPMAATGGGGLSASHVGELAGWVERRNLEIVLMLEGDALEQSIDALVAAGIRPTIFKHRPDDPLRDALSTTKRVLGLKQRARQATPWASHRAASIASGAELDTPVGTGRALAQAARAMATIADPFDRRTFATRFCELVNVEPEELAARARIVEKKNAPGDQIDLMHGRASELFEAATAEGAERFDELLHDFARRPVSAATALTVRDTFRRRELNSYVSSRTAALRLGIPELADVAFDQGRASVVRCENSDLAQVVAANLLTGMLSSAPHATIGYYTNSEAGRVAVRLVGHWAGVTLDPADNLREVEVAFDPRMKDLRRDRYREIRAEVGEIRAAREALCEFLDDGRLVLADDELDRCELERDVMALKAARTVAAVVVDGQLEDWAVVKRIARTAGVAVVLVVPSLDGNVPAASLVVSARNTDDGVEIEARRFTDVRGVVVAHDAPTSRLGSWDPRPCVPAQFTNERAIVRTLQARGDQTPGAEIETPAGPPPAS